MNDLLDSHVCAEIKFERHLEAVPHQRVCKRPCGLGTSLEIENEMHLTLRLLPPLLVLVNHDSLCVDFVESPHAHYIDTLGQTINDYVGRLEETPVFHED